MNRPFALLFGSLWKNPDFMRLWLSDTISVFGSQITILALPLTAALLLHATPSDGRAGGHGDSAVRAVQLVRRSMDRSQPSAAAA
jgi:hypothetical protein